jgi:predicted aspartyl protease
VIHGTVNLDWEPVVLLPVGGQHWPAIVDTGFNGDLELPDGLRPFVNARLSGQVESLLGSGQSIVEDLYTVDFPFDGMTVPADATFVPDGRILLGTHILRHHRLFIDFPAGTVRLERPA